MSIKTRDCPRCGAPVELVYLSESGQRLLVNPGFVPVFLGTQSGGGLSMGRVLHWQTCPAHVGLQIDEEQLTSVVRDGAWKPKEEPDDPRQLPRAKGKRKRKRS